MPRKEQGWITFQASQEELDILEELCRKSQRTKTEILREFLRGLNSEPSRSPKSKSSKRQSKKYSRSHFVQARESNYLNIIQGVVTQFIRTEWSTQVNLKVNTGIELTSVITNALADELELMEGVEAYAVINSNNMVIAKKGLITGEPMQASEAFIKAKVKQEIDKIQQQIINR